MREFFAREERFYLTGGAALAGFHLGHRETEDLDLFATHAVLADGLRALGAAAAALGGAMEVVTDAPAFKRCLIRRGGEVIKVDLVLETATQWFQDKQDLDGVHVDHPQEILANKLCTLLSRCEIRDLVDVLFLERAGYRVEDAFVAAMAKDGGLTPAQLAAVLAEWSIGADAVVPGALGVADLDAYRRDLIRRLIRMAFPERT